MLAHVKKRKCNRYALIISKHNESLYKVNPKTAKKFIFIKL